MSATITRQFPHLVYDGEEESVTHADGWVRHFDCGSSSSNLHIARAADGVLHTLNYGPFGGLVEHYTYPDGVYGEVVECADCDGRTYEDLKSIANLLGVPYSPSCYPHRMAMRPSE